MNSINLPVKDLKKALKALKGIVDGNPILPVMSNVLLSNNRGMISARATNLQIDATVDISNLSTTDDDFEFLVPFKELYKLINLVKSESVSITHDTQSLRCIVTCEDGEFVFPSYPFADFPKNPIHSGNMVFKIDTNLLKSAISVASASVSSDDLRPAMTSICFDSSDDGWLQIVSTDGNTLSCFKTRVPYSGNHFLLDRRIIKAIDQISAKDYPYLKVSVDTHTVLLSCHGITIVSRKEWESYPMYKSVLSEDFSISVSLSSTEIKRKIAMASIFSSRTTHLIELVMKPEMITLKSLDFDYDISSSQSIPVPGDRESMNIGINSYLLSKILKRFSGDIMMNFATPNKPIIIYPECTEGDVTLLIMPVILNPSLT